MKRIIVTFLALFLVANPLVIHQAFGYAGHGGQAVSSDNDAKHSGSDCVVDCDDQTAEGCCAMSLAHCAATTTHDWLTSGLVALSSTRIVFSNTDDTRARLMPESDTPPPRA